MEGRLTFWRRITVIFRMNQQSAFRAPCKQTLWRRCLVSSRPHSFNKNQTRP